ncbi:MAG: DUF6390 family protein [Acidimicrobiales bacterium]
MTSLHDSGPALFARYAYPPNELGYCGPGEPSVLLEAASEGGHEALLSHLARQFEGAWPYLELIAGCNGVSDPLDRRVVEAYWIGNDLTRRVSPSILAASLDDRFSRRAGDRFTALAAAAWNGGVAQHNFHVFAVYPWLGLLRAGRTGAPLEVLDRCRVRWGRVEAVRGDLVSVTSQGLDLVGNRLTLGDERLEVARRGVEGIGFVGELVEGDVVALHWDWICDRLSAGALGRLRAATRDNLRAVNAQDACGPAEALERVR